MGLVLLQSNSLSDYKCFHYTRKNNVKDRIAVVFPSQKIKKSSEDRDLTCIELNMVIFVAHRTQIVTRCFQNFKYIFEQRS